MIAEKRKLFFLFFCHMGSSLLGQAQAAHLLKSRAVQGSQLRHDCCMFQLGLLKLLLNRLHAITQAALRRESLSHAGCMI